MSLFSMDQGAGTATALAGAYVVGNVNPLLNTPMITQDYTVVTVAVAQDAVVLPTVAAGKTIILKNAGATAGKLFAENGGTIDGTAGATGVASAITASVAVMYVCTAVIPGTTGGASRWVRVGAFAA
jgi:hypothetical protein